MNNFFLLTILLSSKLYSMDDQLSINNKTKTTYLFSDEANDSCPEHCILAFRHFYYALTSCCRKAVPNQQLTVVTAKKYDRNNFRQTADFISILNKRKLYLKDIKID